MCESGRAMGGRVVAVSHCLVHPSLAIHLVTVTAGVARTSSSSHRSSLSFADNPVQWIDGGWMGQMDG